MHSQKNTTLEKPCPSTSFAGLPLCKNILGDVTKMKPDWSKLRPKSCCMSLQSCIFWLTRLRHVLWEIGVLRCKAVIGHFFLSAWQQRITQKQAVVLWFVCGVIFKVCCMSLQSCISYQVLEFQDLAKSWIARTWSEPCFLAYVSQACARARVGVCTNHSFASQNLDLPQNSCQTSNCLFFLFQKSLDTWQKSLDEKIEPYFAKLDGACGS